MAIHLEISKVEHPFRLCEICKDKLGSIKVVFEPGVKDMATFGCEDDLGQLLHVIGDGIIRLRQAEREADGTL